MQLTEEDVIKILRLIEESTFSELHLEMGELKLVVRKGKSENAISRECAGSAPAPTEFVGPTVQEPAPAAKSGEEQPSIRAGAATTLAVETEEILVPIKAPLLGIFYRRPEPGAPPYVEVGSFVDENTTVCLIEVMKVFNAVKAGVRGYIRKICAESGDLVEYGQTLFLVEPVSESGAEAEAP